MDKSIPQPHSSQSVWHSAAAGRLHSRAPEQPVHWRGKCSQTISDLFETNCQKGAAGQKITCNALFLLMLQQCAPGLKTESACPRKGSLFFWQPLECAGLFEQKNITQPIHKIKMKKHYKAALLAVLGLASLSAAQAATYPKGDLIVGFTIGSAGAGTDLIYDLGQTSSLTDGQSWDLSSLLTGYNLNNVQWGVIGNTTSPRVDWTTTDGTQAATVGTLTLFNGLNSIDGGIYSFFGTAGAGQYAVVDYSEQNSWYSQTVSPTLTTQYKTMYEDPNVTGLTTATLWNAAYQTTPTEMGSFTLNGSGVLSFNVTPVPEPSTMGLFSAGAGMLVLAWRNKSRRKQG
jgi:hypothetical protein